MSERPEGFLEKLGWAAQAFTLVSIHSTTRALRGTVCRPCPLWLKTFLQ